MYNVDNYHVVLPGNLKLQFGDTGHVILNSEPQLSILYSSYGMFL